VGVDAKAVVDISETSGHAIILRPSRPRKKLYSVGIYNTIADWIAVLFAGKHTRNIQAIDMQKILSYGMYCIV